MLYFYIYEKLKIRKNMELQKRYDLTLRKLLNSRSFIDCLKIKKELNKIHDEIIDKKLKDAEVERLIKINQF